jgi:hypothetical protein
MNSSRISELFSAHTYKQPGSSFDDRIVMRPTTGGDSKHYVAEGDWNLLGKYEGRPGAALRNLEMVAGVRFELTTFGL